MSHKPLAPRNPRVPLYAPAVYRTGRADPDSIEHHEDRLAAARANHQQRLAEARAMREADKALRLEAQRGWLARWFWWAIS